LAYFGQPSNLKKTSPQYTNQNTKQKYSSAVVIQNFSEVSNNSRGHISARYSLGSEAEILQEISVLTHNFCHYHTHLANKNGNKRSCPHRTITKCLSNNSNNLPYARLIERKHVIKVRLPRYWAKHIAELHHNKGRHYASKVIETLWLITLDMWKLRGTKLPESTETTQISKILQLQLHPKVRAVYELKPSLDHIDQQALQQPIKKTLQSPLKLANDWIKQAESFLKQSLQRCRGRIRPSTPPITCFLSNQCEMR
jgi:hypothetical protein